MGKKYKTIKHELIQYYQWLRQYGLNDSHSGNASVKDGNTIWVTPSGACADTLRQSDLIECNINGTLGSRASLDALLHVETYQSNSETAAVLHSHNPYTLALTMNSNEFKPIDFEGALYFETIPVISIAYDQYVQQAPQAVSHTLKTHKACVVKGHGIYVAGKDLNMAYKWTCSLEHSAKIAYLNNQLNKTL